MLKRRISQRERDLQNAIHTERARGYPDANRMVELLEAYTREVHTSYRTLLNQLGYPANNATRTDDDTPKS